ncbi:MAG: cation:proton antiporter [Planctomycetaceae bacterium]|jgi:CPA2 family monovalent cation:H+ antiporter-2|nr:cation:proton antiporter [Planctomycetaceae bacterium]
MNNEIMNETAIIQQLLSDLLIILSAGFIAGVVCKRLRLPMVVGYLLIGALIGSGVLGIFKSNPAEDQSDGTTINIVKTEEAGDGSAAAKAEKKDDNGHDTPDAVIAAPSEQPIADAGLIANKDFDSKEEEHILVLEANAVEHRILDQFAHFGANLLLFAIGIHFSPSELGRIWKHFLAGGLIQMLGVIVPFGLFFQLFGFDWKVGVVLGCAVSLSSTVLVFKSLEDMGLATSLSGLRAVAILLFQDVAIVPLLVIIGILSAMTNGAVTTVSPAAMLIGLAVKSTVFLTFIVGLRGIFVRFIVPFLLDLRNVELIVLFTMILFIGVCGVAGYLGLPGALGALATGVVLSDTRLTHQVSAITVAMRETFSAIFFVSLGALFDPHILFTMPIGTLGMLSGCLFLKTAAAGLAFWVLGLSFVPAMAMGLGLSQLGELSFILIAQGYAEKMFSYDVYQMILFTALTSILLTPLFLKIALAFSHHQPMIHHDDTNDPVIFPEDMSKRALVVGLGPTGAQVAAFLETSGFELSLIDMNPVNLHPYAQHGFQTIAGNANDLATLKLADVKMVSLAVISVPNDSFAGEIVDAVRALNDHCIVVARCRYSANIVKLEQVGANIVLCDEKELAHTAVETLEKLLH